MRGDQSYSTETNPKVATDTSAGVSMVDILTLPTRQQQIVNWIIRRKECGISEIASQIDEDENLVRAELEALVVQGFLQETRILGETRYSIKLAAKRQANSMSDSQALTPGKPLSTIINPSGEIVVTPGSEFELCVTITNQGNQSAIIDVYLDEVSGLLRQWCGSPFERLALSYGQSSEVVFLIQIPPEATPNTYNYLLIIDAPQHYPEDTPIQHLGRVTVTASVQEVVKINDPTFRLLPRTSSDAPHPLQPNEPFQVTVTVLNRSDRVDRFRVSCPELDTKWLTIHYPEGLPSLGIINAADGLQLNPGDRGDIRLTIKPPIDTWAGVYAPTIRLHSSNSPELMLLDVIYIEVLPTYQIDVELLTLLGRVKRQPALYDVRLHNRSNLIREVTFQARSTDQVDLCTYVFAPESVKILPKGGVRVSLQVQPTQKCKPRFFVDRYLPFMVELEDKEGFPLLNNRYPGNLIMESRPWWQFLLLLLSILGTIGFIVFLIWWFFFRPPASPQVVEFASEANSYREVEGEAVRLRWRITNPNRLQEVAIAGMSPDGKIISAPVTYNFSQGIPAELKKNCTIEQVLICQNVPTDAHKAGSYVFELKLVPKDAKGVPVATLKTSTVLIEPIPSPKIAEFTSTRPLYAELKPPTKGTSSNPNANPNTAKESSTSTVTSTSSTSSQNTTTSLPNSVVLIPNDPKADPKNPPLPNGLIQLNWKIDNFRQLKGVTIVGRSPEGEVNSPPVTYDFSRGIPKNLQLLCKVAQDQLVCQSVPTDALKPGSYVFELTTISRQIPQDPKAPPEAKKTDTIKIAPLSSQILELKVNGQEALPQYSFNVTPDIPTILTISWKVEGSAAMKVELLPAPGTVPPVGQAAITLSPQTASENYVLQVTGADGEKVVRSFVVQTIAPLQVPPSADAKTAPPIPPVPEIDSPLVPSDPSGRPRSDSLSPSELPPRRN
ncbi:hypothetical protein V2H45_09645 [Tumidithrix elongata RA019]|uniref:CARDB domain-containing protein n=1 Tax=Tumidithrix elongata BACA0141 TaxID=2716417 RepID=A0AAW9PRZ4_9CYAN|nr:hypothetical protein [Tumidithrix elongata RA019]